MSAQLSEDIFTLTSRGCIAALCIVTTISWLTNKGNKSTETGEDKNGIRWRYAAAFLSFKLGDWMQGPYFHKMYSEKVPTQADVAMLFLIGFLSAAVFGMLSSQLLPKLGSRKGSLCCPVLFLLGTLSIKSNDYSVLLFGRVLGGAASAAMHTIPETWLFNKISENGIPSSMVSSFMSWLFFVDGLGAIASGHLANYAAEETGSSMAPFALSAVPAAVGLLAVVFLWSEETKSEDASPTPQSFMNSVTTVFSSKKLILLVVAQTLFEGTLYLFVMNWGRSIVELTPDGNVPFGQVFASLMAASMIGSSLFGILKDNAAITPFGLVTTAAVIALLSFVMMSYETNSRLLGVLLFEVSCGMYFPAVSLVRNDLLSSDTRLSLSQVLRIPVNVLVIALMLNYETLGITGAFRLSQLTMTGTALCGLLSLESQPKDKKE